MKYPIVALLALLIYGCTDPVNIKLKEGEIQIAVDGSITDQTNVGGVIVPDTVRITRTNGFSSGQSPVVNNALLVLRDNAGSIDTLSYVQDGKYITHTSNIQGVIGRLYELTIAIDGETYLATDVLKRVTTIDSLLSEFRSMPEFGRAPGYFINLYSKDLEGPGDFYRFKVYKNGDLYNRPSDLNLAADAGFGSNNPIDNLRFIFPIREALNPMTGVADPATSGDKAPYVPGDVVKVEIYSLSEATYNFYSELQKQVSNDGLFASPAVNVSTNILNINPSSDKKAVGWFNASAIVSKTIVIQEK
jgi:hypothetical protein